MPIPELILEETDDMYLQLDATTLPTLHVPPTNKRNCRDPRRRGNPRFAASVPGAAVQHRVPLLSHNYGPTDPGSDAA